MILSRLIPNRGPNKTKSSRDIGTENGSFVDWFLDKVAIVALRRDLAHIYRHNKVEWPFVKALVARPTLRPAPNYGTEEHKRMARKVYYAVDNPFSLFMYCSTHTQSLLFTSYLSDGEQFIIRIKPYKYMISALRDTPQPGNKIYTKAII